MSFVLKTYISKFSSSRQEEQMLSVQQRRHLKTALEDIAPHFLSEVHLPRKQYSFNIKYEVGWALASRKASTRYSREQENFAKTLFLDGEQTGQKGNS